MREFGKYLRELRKKARYSLEELAVELRKRGVSTHGSSRQYLGALERGEVSNPSPELLQEMRIALNAIASEFWVSAGQIPPGPHGEAYAELIREANREGFSRMLKDEGLSDAMISNVLSKVSDETIDRVVRREEPLVIKQQITDEEWADHQAMGYETHTLADAKSLMAAESASDYLGSIKDEFASREVLGLGAASQAPRRRRTKRETISAGRGARIVVDRPLDRNERRLLEDVARLIANLLGR
jgi:transcriptional regulator with XRE-family HTH domain